jgi:two-component system C4-dicarboxylate transport sensor histidine kinase DctB
MNARCISENVSVVWQPSIDPAMVMGGHVRLQQVIINLLTNALDAMDNLNPKIIFIDLSQINNTIQMSLRDTGAGLVDPERVFEPFYTTKEIGASKGIGLGLSISYGIIGSFGGEMICNNHDQGGAQFTISLCKAQKQTS